MPVKAGVVKILGSGSGCIEGVIGFLQDRVPGRVEPSASKLVISEWLDFCLPPSCFRAAHFRALGNGKEEAMFDIEPTQVL